jgi:hypothetical protein
MSILDQIAKSEPFRPSTVHEYMALQLAKRLNDVDALDWYLRQVAHVERERLFDTLQKCNSIAVPQRAEQFRSLLILNPIP